ncbi:hypothetical protein BDZ89DRAFT_1034833 [Hymenopellis radicata]|nr:hypothetical protein BDZ89DRAFT_1034833 [Hymenopellis radicata]
MDSAAADERPFSPPPPSYHEPASLLPDGESGSSAITQIPAVSRAAEGPSVGTAIVPSSSLSPQVEPVVLTWVPQNDDPHTSPVPSTSHTDVPPNYVVAQAPTKPVTYMFSPFSHDTMLLIPSAASPDTRPKYHISVRMNCFIPSSFITTVRAGATNEGSVIGDFEMGIADTPATVMIRGKEYPMMDVLKRHGSRLTGSWKWRFFQNGVKIQRLFWDYQEQSVKKCYSGDKKVLYATFMPLTPMRVPGAPVQLQTLTVMPPGQDYFDDIILSILIIERWRLTPIKSRDKNDYRIMFNYG